MKTSKNNELPSGWEIKKLSEVSIIEMGQSPDSINYNEEQIGLPLIQGNADMRNGKSIKRFYTSQITKKCKEGDYILSVRAPVGKIGIASFDSCIGRGVCSIKSKYDDSHFLFQLLLSLENKWSKLEQGSTFSAISGIDIKSFKVLCPPLPEQRAIANILCTWDTAIQTTQALISQKEQEKKWLMQNLLTGKKRLTGFSGEWKEIHIRDIAKEISIKNKSDKQLTVLSCTKYNGLVPSLEYFGRKIYADDVSTYKIVPINHFAYATNHIEEGSIGYQERFEEALISPMYTVFKTNESVNNTFMYRLLKSHPLVYQYQNRMEGSIDRRGGLRWDAFSIIKIKLPSLEEQTAIAQVLQTADKEITLLKTKLEQQKLQKKGLMQVLLTGKKRVKI